MDDWQLQQLHQRVHTDVSGALDSLAERPSVASMQATRRALQESILLIDAVLGGGGVPQDFTREALDEIEEGLKNGLPTVSVVYRGSELTIPLEPYELGGENMPSLNGKALIANDDHVGMQELLIDIIAEENFAESPNFFELALEDYKQYFIVPESMPIYKVRHHVEEHFKEKQADEHRRRQDKLAMARLLVEAGPEP